MTPSRLAVRRKASPRLIAILQALLVTFIWATSWVLIKIGLTDIPALTFAGLRYFLAFLCLLPFAWRSGQLPALRRQSPAFLRNLLLLGIFYYTVTQGTQFVALSYLPSATLSLMLNFTTLLVAFLGIFFLGERLVGRQWAGMLLFFAGVFTFFYPLSIPANQSAGFLVALVGVSANALSSILGRAVNRARTLSPLVVTTVSMGLGSTLLLAAGLVLEPFPALGVRSWFLIVWLALVHTAFAFTLWNKTLRTLSAAESTILNNTMLIQIAILAWIFLGEALTVADMAGLALAAVGILLFQWRGRLGKGAEPPRREAHEEI